MNVVLLPIAKVSGREFLMLFSMMDVFRCRFGLSLLSFVLFVSGFVNVNEPNGEYDVLRPLASS